MFNRLRKATKTLFILINLLFAIFLIVGCYAYKFDPVKFWFAGLFSLGSFFFLLALLIFFFFWLFAKPPLILISTIAIAICWMPLRNLVKISLIPNFSFQKHPKNIRVMSWNVEHFEILSHKKAPWKKEEMFQMINESMPDVACFQEMVASDSFPKAINYIPDFLSQLKFKEYHYSYNSKLDFDKNHHFGIMIFSKFPIINKHTIQYAPNDYNSIFQYVDIVREKDTIRIFNVHLQSLKFDKSNIHFIEKPTLSNPTDIEKSKHLLDKLKIGFLKRAEQSERIKKYILQSPYPVIVCGDFNDVPNSYAYHTIGNGMNNAFAEKGSGIGRTYYSISPTLRIDQIFADNNFNVEQYVRLKKKLSDHFPIIADLYLKKVSE